MHAAPAHVLLHSTTFITPSQSSLRTIHSRLEHLSLAAFGVSRTAALAPAISSSRVFQAAAGMQASLRAGRPLLRARTFTVGRCSRAAAVPARRLATGVQASAASGDELTRCISDNGQVSVLVVRGTGVVQEACNRHKTAPTASAALGRALMGTLLIGAFRGEGEVTQVRQRGGGSHTLIFRL